MTIGTMTRWDKLVIALALISAGIILFPWQFVPYDPSENTVYRLLLHGTWTGALVYLFFRVRRADRRVKWPVWIIAGALSFLGLQQIGWHLSFWGLPREHNRYVWYQKDDNVNEQVIYVYYKGFLPTQGHWDFKWVLDYPKWYFRFEKVFDESDLNGVWRVYDMDNDFNYDKTARFRKGVIEEVVTSAARLPGPLPIAGAEPFALHADHQERGRVLRRGGTHVLRTDTPADVR